MQKRNIWHLLSSLSAEEVKKIPRWLSAELEERQQYVQHLLSLLLASLPEAPSEQALWDQLYPNTAYNDARLRKLLRDVNRYLEEFLAIEAFRRDRQRKDIFLLQEIHKRNLPKLFKKVYQRIDRSLEEKPFRNGAYFRKKYEMESLYQQYLIKHRPKEKNSRLESLYQAYDRWWMYGKVELACLRAHSQFFGSTIQNLFLPEVLLYLEQIPEDQNTGVLQIYRRLYLLLHQQPSDNPHEIRELVQAHETKFTDAELRTIFDLLINYHISRLSRAATRNNVEELYQLYLWGIKRRLIFQQESINLNHYKNIQTVCLQLKKFEQAKNYLERFKIHLSDDIREDAYNFNLATYLFATHKYVKVIEVLRHHKFQQLVFELPARILLIQAHYEQEGPGQDWLLTQIDSLIRFVRNQKLPAHHSKAYLNSLKIIQKLAQILTAGQIQQLAKKHKRTKPLYQAVWLSQKISERIL